MLPDFLIIGAAKSATTWLAHSLGQHPQLRLAPDEIHFFSRHWTRGEAWYARQLDSDDRVATRAGTLKGEKSNTYLYDPEAPGRIARLLPDARLIAILRQPVQRAYAGYCMQLARGQVHDDVQHFLDPASDPCAFLRQGLYGQHLSAYASEIPADRMLLLLYDDLLVDRAQLLSRCHSFLGVEADPTRSAQEPSEKAGGARVNARRSVAEPAALQRLTRQLAKVPLLGPSLRHAGRLQPLRRVWRRVATRPVHYPPLGPELQERLMDYYREDILQLEQLLQRDLSAWLSGNQLLTSRSGN